MPLARVFLEHHVVADARPVPSQALTKALRDMWQAGQTAWPTVHLPAEVFVAHVAERVVGGVEVLVALAIIHASDLYLACACTHADPVAVDAFQKHFIFRVIPPGKQVSTGWSDDVRQIVCERLIVAAPGAQPRIAQYTGRGPLLAWVRTAAARTTVNIRLAQHATESLDGHGALAARMSAPDPDLSVLRRHSREFRQAFEGALTQVSPEQRNVIRFHFLEGLTGDVMAKMYGVSRRTVHRWIEEARNSIVALTRKALADTMKTSPDDLETLMRVLQSDLASTVVRYLGPDK